MFFDGSGSVVIPRRGEGADAGVGIAMGWGGVGIPLILENKDQIPIFSVPSVELKNTKFPFDLF